MIKFRKAGKIDKDDCSADATATWSKTDCTLVFDTDHYEITQSAATQAIYKNVTLVPGRKYRLSLEIQDGTEASVNFTTGIADANMAGNLYQATTTTATTGSWTSILGYAEAISSHGCYYISTAIAGAGNNIEVRNISLDEVPYYLPEIGNDI